MHLIFIRCQADGDTFIALAHELQKEEQTGDSVVFDEELLRKFSYCCAGSLSPMQAVIGGMTAQEVMKVGYVMYYLQYAVK